jgi:hypothetical protein
MMQPPPPVPARRRRWPWIAAGAAVVAAGAVAGGVALAGAGSPKVFTLHGEITIENDYPSDITDAGGGCRGTGGYSDMTPGTAVTVADPTGQVVATGRITTGRANVTQRAWGDSSVPYLTACSLLFEVSGVPDGLASYSLTISHRGTRVLSPAEAHASVELTLGSS